MNQVPVPTPVPHPASKIRMSCFEVFDPYKVIGCEQFQRQLYPGGEPKGVLGKGYVS